MLDCTSFRLDASERECLAADGYVVRERAFDAGECAAIAADCEALIHDLYEAGRHTKHRVGSYMFELQRKMGTMVKWEPDAPEVIQGVEPFGHICPGLRDWGLDARLLDPCRDLIGQDDIVLFTEKLNVKRARDGGIIILHQDFPYWENMTPVAGRIVTAMLFLDDATSENGCLEVAPASHTVGKHPLRTDVADFGSLEMDVDQFDLSRLVPLEVPAGTVVFFDAFLVHRSLPNRSDRDRRALLYSYQPAGHPHALELNRLLAPKT